MVGEALAVKAKLHLMSMATNHLLLQGHEGEVDLQARVGPNSEYGPNTEYRIIRFLKILRIPNTELFGF